MTYREFLLEPVLERWMIRFGAAMRAARLGISMSQRGLAWRSGLDQGSISRLEAGRTPYMSLVRLARISIASEGRIPLATCPHDHVCPWRMPLVDQGDVLTYTRHQHFLRMGVTERAHLDMLDDPRYQLRPED